MAHVLVELLGEIFFSSFRPWRYLFSAKCRRETHNLWRRQSHWLTAFQIALGLVIYGIALGVIALVVGVIATNRQ